MIMGVMVGSAKAGSPTAIHSSSRTKNKKIGLGTEDKKNEKRKKKNTCITELKC